MLIFPLKNSHPYMALACAVMGQALDDAAGREKNLKKNGYLSKAWEKSALWFLDGNGTYDLINGLIETVTDKGTPCTSSTQALNALING